MKYLILSFLFFCSCFETALALSPQRAEAYFQAQQYMQAINIWKKTLEEGNAELQANAIYNIGTAFLASGDVEQALDYFQSLKFGKDPSLLLLQKVKFNQALALFEITKNNISALHPHDLALKEKLNFFLLQFKQALNLVDEAEKAHCTLIKLAGGPPECNTSENYQQLRNAINLQTKEVQHMLSLPLPTPKKWPENTPGAIIEHIIDIQRHAFSLLALQHQDDIVKAQQNTVQHSNSLANAISISQEQEFKKNQCNQKRWEDVLSLYQQGHDAADIALLDIKAGAEWHPFAIQRQIAALDYWQKALEALENTTNKTIPIPITKDLISKPMPATSNVYQLLNLLNAMDQQDYTPPENNEPIKQGERPW